MWSALLLFPQIGWSVACAAYPTHVQNFIKCCLALDMSLLPVNAVSLILVSSQRTVLSSNDIAQVAHTWHFMNHGWHWAPWPTPCFVICLQNLWLQFASVFGFLCLLWIWCFVGGAISITINSKLFEQHGSLLVYFLVLETACSIVPTSVKNQKHIVVLKV